MSHKRAHGIPPSPGSRYGPLAGLAGFTDPALAGAALLARTLRRAPRDSGGTSSLPPPQAASGAPARGAAASSSGLFVPIFLHARELAVGRPRKKPVRALAPLPPYMVTLAKGMGWRLQAQRRQG